MRQKAREFYEEAKVLAAAKKFNGAASRLYYALYHIIIAVFEEKGVKQSNLTTKVEPGKHKYWLHEVVVDYSTRADVSPRDAWVVRTLQELRGRADYEIDGVKAHEILPLFSKVEAIFSDLGHQEGKSMTKTEICEAIQNLVRQAYSRVIVRPSTNEWNPDQDVLYKIFFVPDSAAGEEWYEHIGREGGWFDQAEKMGVPPVLWSPVYDSSVKKHYAHLFPEVFGNAASATSNRKQTLFIAKRGKSKSALSRAKVS